VPATLYNGQRLLAVVMVNVAIASEQESSGNRAQSVADDLRALLTDEKGVFSPFFHLVLVRMALYERLCCDIYFNPSLHPYRVALRAFFQQSRGRIDHLVHDTGRVDTDAARRMRVGLEVAAVLDSV
jgi:hypothetical protein